MSTAEYSNLGPALNPDTWKTLSSTYGSGASITLGPFDCTQYDSLIIALKVSQNGGSSNDIKYMPAAILTEKNGDTFETYPEAIRITDDGSGDLNQYIMNDSDVFIDHSKYVLYKISNAGGTQGEIKFDNGSGDDRGTLTVKYKRANFLWYG